jgi:putative OPT family oligopeptide transporter
VPIHELNEEQIQTWTLEEKDKWWLTTVFRGNMPQLTLRAALTGMLLGGLLSLTNLYVGAKTGWTLGVGITSVILAYGLFRVLARSGLVSEFTVLENNAMQSIATAAGYMTSPMISSLAAYMMVTNHVIPMWQTMAWIVVLALLGVLFAFPFKRRFINDEQQPFPEGRAAGIVMDALHHGDAAASLLKAKLLALCVVVSAAVKFLQAESIMALARIPAVPEFLDELIYERTGTPKILGTPVTNLTLRPEFDLVMIGTGGLMGMRTAGSLFLGALVNYAILAPLMIHSGDIVPNAKGTIGFREITFWSLWCGVAMVTAASIVSFFAKPQVLIGSFTKLFRRSEQSSDVLRDIELPLSVSIVGIPILGAVVIYMAHAFFGVEYWLGLVALMLVSVFCLIAINSTGLTSITPIGAMGKLTQLTFGALAPGNRETNLMTAGITGEVASHSANLLSDIKPGYMLGAKPRQQAMGHALGVLAGALLSVPVFYIVFLKLQPDNAFSVQAPHIDQVDFSPYPMTAATIWKAVADILSKGLETIPPTAQVAALIGIVIGAAFEVARFLTRNKMPLSPVALGLGFVIPFFTCLSMFLGALVFWVIEQRSQRARPIPPTEEELRQSSESESEAITTAPLPSRPVPPGGPGRQEEAPKHVLVENQEPICAGLIAGGALMGIAVQVFDVFILPRLSGK